MIKNLLAVIGAGTVVYVAVKINNWIVAIRVQEEINRRAHS